MSCRDPLRKSLGGFVLMACAALVTVASATTAFAGDAGPRVKSGLEKRTLWTGSKVVRSPDPPSPYRVEVAFPKLPGFSQPLDLSRAEGLDRLFVAERLGKLFTFRDDPSVEQADLMLDVGKTVYGLAAHPKFKENGYIYVTHVLDPANPSEKGTRLSRFTAQGNPPRAELSSEQLILEWPSGGHNGGCLAFGPDGYLYIVTGDGSGIADELQTGQDLSDLLAAMLRIDVDHHDAGKAYAIPKDNPFVKQPHARGEIYAYGLRQAWKFHFDPPTRDLWAGEVGQDLWESIYRIEKGGNYGWSVREGSHPFRPERKQGPTEFKSPVVEQNHTLFRSITGGYVYHGKRLPELAGQYIYGDYDTGKVWAFRWDGKKAVDNRELCDTTLRIIDFGVNAAEELFLLDFISGRLFRLAPTPPTQPVAPFPRKLSETGLFASTKEHRPAAGLIPYSVNSPLWSDGAEKDRFIAIPGEGKIDYNAIEYPQPAPGAPRGWRFPDGTVIVKTFSMEMEKGNPKSVRRLETRLLHFEQLPGNEEIGDQVWRGYTYVWNEEQTDAVLLASEGENRTLTIKDPAAPGGKREQVWRFPSRAECTLCHTMPGKYVLGVNTLQMNKDHDYGGQVANQLDTLAHIGLFNQPLPDAAEKLPKLVDYRDEKQPLAERARSYLHSNCAHCHMKWGGGNAEFQLLATLPLEETGTVNTPPGQGAFGIAGAKVLIPGDPERSLIYHRMDKLGLGRMPHIASNVKDEAALKLIRAWLQGLEQKK